MNYNLEKVKNGLANEFKRVLLDAKKKYGKANVPCHIYLEEGHMMLYDRWSIYVEKVWLWDNKVMFASTGCNNQEITKLTYDKMHEVLNAIKKSVY